MRSLSAIFRIIGLAALAIALAVGLGACSAIKLGYNQLPDLAFWWLDGYIDTNGAQTPRLRDDITRLHQWHRQNELPRYADLLQKMQQLAPGSLAPDQVCSVFDELRGRATAVVDQLEPSAVALARSLTPEQIRHIERKYAKSNDEWQADWLKGSPAERLQRRTKQAIERSETFYGTLQEPQLAAIRASIAQSSFNAQTSWTERLRRQQDLIQTLTQVGGGKAGEAQTRTALRGWLDRSLNSPNPAYRAYSQGATREACVSFAAVHNSTTPDQRDRAVKRLKAYERDFRELAGQGM